MQEGYINITVYTIALGNITLYAGNINKYIYPYTIYRKNKGLPLF